MSYRLGIDIGGTFTDFVAYDEAGRALKAWKNLSTPHDPTAAIASDVTDNAAAARPNLDDLRTF